MELLLLMIMADSHNHPHTTSVPPLEDDDDDSSFEVSDFFELTDWFDEDVLDGGVSPPPFPASTHYHHHPVISSSNEILLVDSSSSSSILDGTTNRGDNMSSRTTSAAKEKKEIREKVAFKTKSEVEVLDDGFKWRKYGKKMVKNSPNPRNYYRCSIEGCPVKKRVERDKEDPRYVVTTYEGIHNHLHAGAAAQL